MDDAPPDSEDDSSISDDEILYRRIAHYGSGDLVAVDAITGHRRPSLAAVPSSRTTTASRSISTASSPKLLWVRKISSCAAERRSLHSEPLYLGSCPSVSFVTHGRPAPTTITTRETPRTPR